MSDKSKRIAVIGAGVSGLVAAKRLRAEGLYVRVFERALCPGGVWIYSEDATAPFATPMYDPLETNYPRDLMEFADQPWPEGTPLYPSRQQVLDYVRAYSKGVEVEYGTEVVDLFKRTAIWPQRWRLTIQKRGSDEKTPLDFDAVVVCIGTFDKPVLPDYPGQTAWEEAYPGSVLHSKAFRDVDSYRGKNVVVVGNGPSGRDISNKLARVAKTVWLSSTRSTKADPKDPEIKPGKPISAGPVKAFNHKTKSIEFENGHSITKIDSVVFCTGYQYSHSFVRKGVRAKEPLHGDGMRVDGLWAQMFWIEEATLVFIGIPKDGPTFLIAQAQAAFAARYLADISRLLSRPAMKREVAADLKAREDEKLDIATMAHRMDYIWCKKYMENLQTWCEIDDAARAEPVPDGNKPFRWTKRIDWIMENAPKLGEAYRGKVRLRRKYPTPESLGLKELGEVPKKE